MPRPFYPAMTTLRGAILLASLALAGCAGDANPVRDLAVAAGVTGGEPKPAPDFVSSTRTGRKEFIPVGTSAPPRRLKAKDPSQVKNAEGEMQAVSRRNQARGSAARDQAGQD